MHQEEKPSYFNLNKAGALNAALPFLFHAQGDAAFISLSAEPSKHFRYLRQRKCFKGSKNKLQSGIWTRFLLRTLAEIHSQEWMHNLSAALTDRYLSLYIWKHNRFVSTINPFTLHWTAMGQSRREVWGRDWHLQCPSPRECQLLAEPHFPSLHQWPDKPPLLGTPQSTEPAPTRASMANNP